MNISERNKKVAIARWNKIHNLEKDNININLEKVAAICGFLSGDGSVQVRKEKNNFHYQLDFFPDDILMKNKYLELIFDVFKKSPSVVKRDNVFHVRLTSKTVVLELKKWASFGLKNWIVPDFLYTNALRCAWLSGFFSAEAYVDQNRIKVQTINKEGMKGVQKMLDELGIISKYYEYEPKNKNYSKVFILVISRKSNLLKFYECVGFWHTKKQNRLKKALLL